MKWHLVDFGNFWLNDLYALVPAGTIVGISVLTYRFVELPGLRLFIGLATRRFTRTVTAS